MGHIIKPICSCVLVCVCVHLSLSHFFISVHTIGTEVITPKGKNEFIRRSVSHHAFPYFAPKTPHFMPFKAYICHKCLQIADVLASYRKMGSRNMLRRAVMSDSRPEVDIWPFRACAMKNMHYKLFIRANRGNSRVL